MPKSKIFLYQGLRISKMPRKSTHNCLSYHANKQTYRETRVKTSPPLSHGGGIITITFFEEIITV